MGKGSKQRPRGISKEQFEENWNKIFGRKKTPKHGKTQVKIVYKLVNVIFSKHVVEQTKQSIS